MAKKFAKVKPKVAPTNDKELRRWCIEQAIRWPWDAGRDYQNGMSQFPGRPAASPDILQRAAQILGWVQAS